MCYERRPSAQNNGPRTSSGAALTSAVLYGRIYGRNWVSVAAGDGPGRRRHGVDDIIERLGSARRRPTGVIPTSRRRRRRRPAGHDVTSAPILHRADLSPLSAGEEINKLRVDLPRKLINDVYSAANVVIPLECDVKKG